MSYCENCGRFIENEQEGCPYCRGQNIQPIGDNSSKFQSANLGNGLKVTIVAVTLLVPLLGLIFGVIMSLYYLGLQNRDTRSYGKALLILCIVIIVMSILCCLIWFVLGLSGYYSEPVVGNGYSI